MDLGGSNDAQADRSVPVVWSQQVSGDTNYLPACVTEADYLINLAELKGHSYGITLTSKNHFGTLMNSSRLRPPEAAGIHRYLTQNQMDAYTVLVDLMGNYQLGEKTMLYMLDAVICAPSEGSSITGENARWQQSPFNGGYASSLFFSQDPVAIDSVGADFLMNEPSVINRNSALRDNPNVENYLHEAGLVADAPSGSVYYNGNGERSEAPDTTSHRTLVVYYSLSRRTEDVVKRLQEKTNGDLYELVPSVPYTGGNNAISQRAREEVESENYPSLSGMPPDLSQYDTILIGGPVWNSTLASPLYTYLSETDFTGKTVAPFWTDQGTPGNYAQDFTDAVKSAVRVTEFLQLTNTTSIAEEDMSQRLDTWLEAVLE